MRQFSLLLAVAVFLSATVAEAYVPSPQNWAFELKFGPYKPNVDEEPGIGTPYQDTFGGKNMFLTQLELDYQFFRRWGLNFGVGFSFGFMQEYTPERSESGAESAEYTVLNVMPFALLAVLRIDALHEKLGVPLVPYVKAGFNWYLWWVLSGGSVARSALNNDKAIGGTVGWQANVGLAFQLDMFDRTVARTFDNEVGVNHSYIFIELVFAGVEGFGRDGYMYLSPDNFLGNATIMSGLAFEF